MPCRAIRINHFVGEFGNRFTKLHRPCDMRIGAVQPSANGINFPIDLTVLGGDRSKSQRRQRMACSTD